MSQRHWVPRLFARSSRTPIVNRKAKSRPSFRPVLELLEDRLAPALLTVNTLAEGSSNTNQLTLREAVDLVNSGGNPGALGQSSMPAGWASQIGGSFGDNDTIQFAPGLAAQDAGYGAGVIALTNVGDTSVGPSALVIDPGINLTIAGPTGNSGITIERAPNAKAMRLFQLDSTAILTSAGSLTLENLTLRGGDAVGGNGGSGGLGGGGGGAAGLGGAIYVEPFAVLSIQDSTLTGNTAQGGNGGVGGNSSGPHAPSLTGNTAQGGNGGAQASNASLQGGGGGGLGSAGYTPTPSNNFDNNGGGPYGGAGLLPNHGLTRAGAGGFGGGGGGGSYYDHTNGVTELITQYGEPGGNGGNGGGGGGGGGGNNVSSGGETSDEGGNGGNGGFGGGGGGGGRCLSIPNNPFGSYSNGSYGAAGYGGGNGGSANGSGSGSGGGGAGMGGAVFNDGGTVIITDSTLTGNSAIGGQAGFYPPGVTQGPIGQAGSGLGGAIFNTNGDLNITYSTLDANNANKGGAIFSLAQNGLPENEASFATVTLGDSILANTRNGNSDFWGVSIADGTADYIGAAANLIQNNHGFAPPPGSPLLLTGVNPNLGPLADSGGPTPTMTPLQGSPVINQGANLLTQPYDQRGLPRIYNNGVDLGAVELNPATITVNTTNEVNADPNSLSLLQAVELADNTLTRASLSPAQDMLVQGDPSSGVTTIEFAASLAGQTISLITVSDNQFGPTSLLVTNNLTIDGQTGSNSGVTLAGPGAGGNLRLFRIAPGASLTLAELTLTGGNLVGNPGGNAFGWGGGGGGAAGLGGAILNQGSLTLVNSTLSGDSVRGGTGGSSNNSIGHSSGGGGGGGQQAAGSDASGQSGGGGGGPNSGRGGLMTIPPGSGEDGGVGGAYSGGGGGYSRYNYGGGGGGGGGVGKNGGGGGGGGEVHGSFAGAGGLGALFGGGGGGGGYYHGYYGAYNAGGPGGYGGLFGGNGGSGGNQFGGGGGGGAGLGGAIFNYDGKVTVIQSTFDGDKAYGGLGGNNGANAGQGAGGAVFNYGGTVTVTNSTLAGNGADRGSDVFNYASQSSSVVLNNTILADSTTTAADYDQVPGSTSSGSDNLIQANNGFLASGIVSNANPLLSALANHGGPTPTLLPQANSPVINAGNNAFLTVIAQAESVSNSAATDQDGLPRLFGPSIDIGAVEVHQLTNIIPPPAAPAALQFVPLAPTITAGQGPGTIQVEVLNSSGQVLSKDNSDQVTLSGIPSAAGNTLTVTVHNGIAAFNGVVIDQAGTYILTASSGLLSPVQVQLTAIEAGPANDTPPPLSPPVPSLNAPPLLALLDQLFAGIETMNADGSVTVTDSWFGLPFLVSTFDSAGGLENVTWLGIDVTLLFELS